MSLQWLFRPAQPVPAEYRSTFTHLYGDIAWFGVLAGSLGAFTSVYAARQGASAFQIGLLTAGPAIVNLVFTLPASQWLERQPMNAAVFWTAVMARLFYLLWIPLPVLLGPQHQVWAIIGLTLLLTIPGTPLAVGFNALFADAVPATWRGYVAGIRNALLSVTYIAVSLLCGQILVSVPFPTGYQIVFAIGCVGGAMSTVHLWFVVPRGAGQASQPVRHRLRGIPITGVVRSLLQGLRSRAGLSSRLLNVDVLRGPYGRLMAVLFALNFTLYLAIPLFPLHWVNNLHLTDREIAFGNALFYVTTFFGSAQLAGVVRRLGNQRVTAIGMMTVCLYPALMSLSRGLNLFLVASAIGGFGSALLNGALLNYILEKIPEDRRPPYLGWYNLIANAALLLGSLVGPSVAGLIGMRWALGVAASLRLLSALWILRWE